MSLRRSEGTINTSLEIYLYRNRLQLTTPDACYSDGDHYTPAVSAVKYLKPFLPSVNNVLALGTGLGSIVHVLARYGFHPAFTLVENDKTVLSWAMELMEGNSTKLEPVCADAMVFMEKNKARYDLVFIDIFMGRVVPVFVTTPAFLRYCRNSLAPGGRLVFNYIVNDSEEWESVLQTFEGIFPGYHMINSGINRILISGK